MKGIFDAFMGLSSYIIGKLFGRKIDIMTPNSIRTIRIKEVAEEVKRGMSYFSSKVERCNSKYIAIAIILLVSVGVYANTLLNGFVYDDVFQVLKNEWIKDVRNIPKILFSNVWSFMEKPIPINYYRPTMHFIYMADYYLFEFKPWGYHLTNIIIHSINCLMVFLIAITLLNKANHNQSNTQKHGYKILNFALIAAIFFAVHPVNTEPVAWIAGIPELSFTLFYLLSFYLYIKYSVGSKGYIIAVILFFFAALSKETALTLPILLFIYDYAFRRDSIKTFSNYIKRYLPFAIVAGIYISLRIYALGGLAPQKPRHDYLTIFQYVINVFPLIVQYFGKLLLPVNLNAFHVLHPVYSVLELRFIISLLLTISFFIFVILIRKVNTVTFFTLAWIFIPLLPVLYIPGVGENTFAERYLYLPSAGFSVLGAYLFTNALYKLEYRRMGVAIKKVLITSICVIIGLYSTGTIKRSLVWKNELNLWSDTVKKSPDSAMGHYNLGISYYDSGQIDNAIVELKEAIKIRPDYADARYNLGAVYQNKGLLKDAVAEYQEVIMLSPNSADVYYNLGLIYTQSNFLDQAILAFQEALRIKPDYREARYGLEKALYLKQQ